MGRCAISFFLLSFLAADDILPKTYSLLCRTDSALKFGWFFLTYVVN